MVLTHWLKNLSGRNVSSRRVLASLRPTQTRMIAKVTVKGDPLEQRQMLSGLSATNDTGTVTAGEAVTIDVIANDIAAGDSSIAGVSSAAHGIVEINAGVSEALQIEYDSAGGDASFGSIDGYVTSYYGSWDYYSMMTGDTGGTPSLTYTATDITFAGTDNFTYTLEDASGLQSIATVTVTVDAPAPSVAIDDVASIDPTLGESDTIVGRAGKRLDLWRRKNRFVHERNSRNS